MHRFVRVFLVVCCAFSLSLPQVYAATKAKHKSSSAGKKSKHSRIRTKPHSDDYMDGVASCYAAKFIGRKTTSGDRFTMDKYTGAHPTLPMRTKLKVTNLKNDKIVYIEVNDRMAKSSGHVIDLTLLAAKRIGICPGLGQVHLDILDNDSYNALLKGQLGQLLILANPLLSESATLELANQYANAVHNESDVKNDAESSDDKTKDNN